MQETSVNVGKVPKFDEENFLEFPQSRGVESSGSSSSVSPSEEERCRVPEFAKKMGHEEKWKLHNGCY